MLTPQKKWQYAITTEELHLGKRCTWEEVYLGRGVLGKSVLGKSVLGKSVLGKSVPGKRCTWEEVYLGRGEVV